MKVQVTVPRKYSSLVRKTSTLPEDPPGDTDGAGLGLEKVRSNSTQIRTFRPSPPATKGRTWRGLSKLILSGHAISQASKSIHNHGTHTWNQRHSGMAMARKHMNTLAKQDGENVEAGNL
jgi:hypothetical protein